VAASALSAQCSAGYKRCNTNASAHKLSAHRSHNPPVDSTRASLPARARRNRPSTAAISSKLASNAAALTANGRYGRARTRRPCESNQNSQAVRGAASTPVVKATASAKRSRVKRQSNVATTPVRLVMITSREIATLVTISQ